MSAKLLLPPANEVCEGYVFTGVCLSTRGGHAWFFLGGHAWFFRGGMRGFFGGCTCFFGGAWFFRRGHAWFFRGVCVVFGGCAWFFRGACMVFSGGACVVFRGDTVNERAVRILLECILVDKTFARNWMKMKEIGPRASASLAPSHRLDPPM